MPITKAKRRSYAHRANVSPVPLIEDALNRLRMGRYLLRTAGAKNAADYVARALKSAEGALRHARSMANAAERGEAR